MPNQTETLLTARSAAADGCLSTYTIPLLAEPETLKQTARLNWVLRFPLPPPSPHSNRRFSSTQSYNHGHRTPQALDAAIRYAASFTYDDSPPSHPLTSAFMQLPDPVTRFAPIRRSVAAPLHPSPTDIQDWLRNGAVRLHSQDEYRLCGASIATLPSLLESHFFGHINLDQLITLIDTAPFDPDALHNAVQHFRATKRAKIEAVPTPQQPPPCASSSSPPSLFRSLLPFQSLLPFLPMLPLLTPSLTTFRTFLTFRTHLLAHAGILIPSLPRSLQTVMALGNPRLVWNQLVPQALLLSVPPRLSTLPGYSRL